MPYWLKVQRHTHLLRPNLTSWQDDSNGQHSIKFVRLGMQWMKWVFVKIETIFIFGEGESCDLGRQIYFKVSNFRILPFCFRGPEPIFVEFSCIFIHFVPTKDMRKGGWDLTTPRENVVLVHNLHVRLWANIQLKFSFLLDVKIPYIYSFFGPFNIAFRKNIISQMYKQIPRWRNSCDSFHLISITSSPRT